MNHFRSLFTATLLISCLSSLYAVQINEDIKKGFDSIISGLIPLTYSDKGVVHFAGRLPSRVRPLIKSHFTSEEKLNYEEILSVTHTLIIVMWNLAEAKDVRSTYMDIELSKSISAEIKTADDACNFIEGALLLSSYLKQGEQETIPENLAVFKDHFMSIFSDIRFINESSNLKHEDNNNQFLNAYGSLFQQYLNLSQEDYATLLKQNKSKGGWGKNKSKKSSPKNKPFTARNNAFLASAGISAALSALSLAASQLDTIPGANKKIKIPQFFKEHGQKIAIGSGSVAAITLAVYLLK